MGEDACVVVSRDRVKMSHEKDIQDLIAALRDALPAGLLEDAQRDPRGYEEEVFREIPEYLKENIRRTFSEAKNAKCRARVAKSVTREALRIMATSRAEQKESLVSW